MTRDDIAHLMNDTAPRLSGWGTEAHFQNFAQALIEACAKVCEETTASWTQHLYNDGCIDCAKAIRKRGEQE